MRTIARNWLIQNKIGLISGEELISLADNYIAENDEFPDWMIDISTNSSLERVKGLDLVMEPITEVDCKVIAGQMLELLTSNTIGTSHLATACEQMYLSLEWGSTVFNHFIWLSDEISLNEKGYKETENLDKAIKDELCKIAAL
jgi:hypothetical protein